MTLIVICDRCGRLITKISYHRFKFKDGTKWDCCGNCASAVKYCNQALHDIVSSEEKVIE